MYFFFKLFVTFNLSILIDVLIFFIIEKKIEKIKNNKKNDE